MKNPAASKTIDLNTYRQVFDASPDFITISRLSDGKYIDVNPGYLAFTGYSRSEAIGHTALELGIWPSNQDRHAFVATLEARGNLYGVPIQLRNRLGEVKDVEMSATITLINGEKVLVSIVRDVSERRKNEIELAQYRDHLEKMVQERTEQLSHMAQHDVLTGLPNRILLEDRISQAIHSAQRNHKCMAVMLIDLDKFKPVNDTHGHQIGDALLCAVAERLQQNARKTDTVARFGGDEFIVVLPDLQEQPCAVVVAEKIISALHAPFIVNGIEIHIGGSIGAAMYPTDGDGASVLIQRADAAMYSVKHGGRGNYQFFGNLQGDSSSVSAQTSTSA